MDYTHIKLKDERVNVDNLNPALVEALEWLGERHHMFFNTPMLITSGNDGKHRGKSHYQDRAVDIRSWDKSPLAQLWWATVLSIAVITFKLAVFDERMRDGNPHYHIELA